MRLLLVIPLILLCSSPSLAEEYGVQGGNVGQSPYPQEARVEHVSPYYTPAPIQAASQPQPAHSPAALPQPVSSDYGKLVVTDIRQMNF